MRNPRSNKKFSTVWIHVLAWAIFGLFFYYQPVFSGAELTAAYLARQTVTLFLLVLAFYLNATVLVPGLLFRNHSAWYIVMTIGLVLSIAWIERSANQVLSVRKTNRTITDSGRSRKFDQVARPPSPPISPARFRPGLRDIFILTVTALVIGISTAVTVTRKWRTDNEKRKELEKDKLDTELSMLKAQINPHFFFNTLNNIYVLTAVDAKLAGEAIYQLSKLMRYLLYDTQHAHSLLSEEIAFIRNYISLMQLRLTDLVTVNLQLPSAVEDQPIAPMLLLPFIENAFKHGVSTKQSGCIDIRITQNHKQFELFVQNPIILDNSVSLDTSSGIGLANTKRRLELLYPHKHKLDIKEIKIDRKYSVHLLIDLS